MGGFATKQREKSADPYAQSSRPSTSTEFSHGLVDLCTNGNGRSARIAGAAGRFGQRVLSGSFLPFPVAPVRQEGAKTRRSPRSSRTDCTQLLLAFQLPEKSASPGAQERSPNARVLTAAARSERVSDIVCRHPRLGAREEKRRHKATFPSD